MASDWHIGDKIPDPVTGQVRWDVHNILRGGMGIVYVVYDHALGESVALKTFQDEVFARSSSVADQFAREARTWINLDYHENVVQARLLQEISRKPFIFLEYVTGGDLSGWIGTPRLTKDLPQVLRFAIQFCDGMHHAFSKGIQVHRDIKPQNCLVTEDNNLKVTDFGLAKVFDDTPRNASYAESSVARLGVHLTQTGRAVGTCTHMAPEQFVDAKHVDVRADIYSFGVMVFQMVTGRLPFEGRRWEDFARAHMKATPPPLDSGQPALDMIVAKCLAKVATGRYGEFRTLREELASIYESVTRQPATKPATGRGLNAFELNSKGAALASLRRHEEALACYDRALDIAPQEAVSWFVKGNLLASLRRHEEALTCYDRALALNPELAEAWFLKGESLQTLERFDESIACCERALNLNSGNAEAWLLKGNLHHRLEHYEDALQCYDRALEVDPKYRAAWNNKGAALANLNRYEESLLCFDRNLTLNPQDNEAWRNKGGSMANLGRLGGALACLERALAIAPQDVEAWTYKAHTLERLGRHEEALACWDSVLALNAQDANAWFNKGAALAPQFNSMQEAIRCFEKAEQLGSPNAAEAIAVCRRILAENMTEQPTSKSITGGDPCAADLTDQGVALWNIGRSEEALACFDRALAIDAQYAEAWNGKGVALASLDNYEEALVCLDRALAIDSQYAQAWCNKAISLSKLGRSKEALDCFDRALAFNPRDEQTWYNKGTALWSEEHNNEEALACLDRALALNPQMDRAWRTKGNVLRSIGGHEEALTCYDRALALNPQDAGAWFNKGVVLADEFKRVHQAIRCFEEAQHLGHPNAAKAIAICQKRADG